MGKYIIKCHSMRDWGWSIEVDMNTYDTKTKPKFCPGCGKELLPYNKRPCTYIEKEVSK